MSLLTNYVPVYNLLLASLLNWRSVSPPGLGSFRPLVPRCGHQAGSPNGLVSPKSSMFTLLMSSPGIAHTRSPEYPDYRASAGATKLHSIIFSKDESASEPSIYVRTSMARRQTPVPHCLANSFHNGWAALTRDACHWRNSLRTHAAASKSEVRSIFSKTIHPWV